MPNEKKQIECEKDETLLELLSRSGLNAIMPFLDRSDEPPRNLDYLFDEDSLVHEASPKGT